MLPGNIPCELFTHYFLCPHLSSTSVLYGVNSMCGKRLMKRGQKKSSYECKGFADDMLKAFTTNTTSDNAHMCPERF